MANKIIIKKSSVAGKVPLSSDLDVAELAVNLADQKLYTKNAGGTVVQLGGGSGSGDVVGPSSATDNAIPRYDGTTGKLIQNSGVTLDDNDNLLNPRSVQLSGAIPAAPAPGALWFDSTTDTLNLQQNAITQQVGEELYVYGKASAAISGETILQAIYKTGTVGSSGVIQFAPTVSGITDGGLIIGVATEDIATNGFGRVTNFGIVHGINTTGATYSETWADGDDIWYNPVTGGLTKTKPSAPNIKVQIGTVINAGSGGSGSFQVLLNTGSVLGGTDSNVQITSPASGNALIYDATAGYWKNANITAGTGIGVTNGAGSITVSNSGVTSLTGTTNEIDVSASTGSVTLSLPATINADTTGNAATATSAGKWTTARTLSFTGDATGSGSVDGSASVATALTLANTAVTAGSYTNTALTVDSKGRITAASSGTAPVTSVGATAPIQSSGGVTPTISITQASSTTNGYLSSTDWNTFNGKGSGTVTSVSGTGTASGLSLSGTVTSSGSLTLSGTVNALAAGTYAISISGNAATATTSTNAGNADTLDGQHGSYYQPASTAITTSNIGSQSVNYATSSGSASSATNATTATNQSGGTVNATSILSSQGVSDTYSGIRVVNPGGGALIGQNGAQSGAIKIKLPTASLNSSTMLRFTVKIYEYNTGYSRTFEIGGYNYVGGSWYNWFATQSSQSGGDMTVRFGQDSTSDCVWIGETSSSWSYPQVFITDVQCGYSNASQALWANGWAVSFVTSFDTVEASTTAYRPISSGNYNSYSPTLTGGGASGTWGINISGNAATASNGGVTSVNGQTGAVTVSASAFPAGTIMLFRQTAAPTGWTKDTTNYDGSAMRVVTGTVSSGGTVAFTTAFASQAVAGTVGSTTATGTNSGGAVAATTLATTQIPSHTHSYSAAVGQWHSDAYCSTVAKPQASNTGATGGGGSHTHTFTQPTFTGAAHTHTFTGTAINLAVKYCDVIFATKN